MQKINLTDIIDDIFLNCPGDTTKFLAKTLAKQCALEFGKQLLELAVDNAELNWIENEVKVGSNSDFAFRDSDGNWCKISLDERSILNIIKQVE